MVENNRLMIMETVRAAWSKVSGSKGTIWAVMGIAILLQVMLGILGQFTPAGAAGLVGAIVAIVGLIIQLFLAWGMIYLGIERAAGNPIQFDQVKIVLKLNLFLRMIGLYFLQMLILGSVLVVFMIPPVLAHNFLSDTMEQLISAISYLVGAGFFVFFAMRLFLAKGFVIRQGLGPITGIKKSFEKTESNVCRLFGLGVINILILVVSVIPLGIGLIWSLPYLLINYGEVFKKLNQ